MHKEQGRPSGISIARRRLLALGAGAMALPRLARAQEARNLRLGWASILPESGGTLVDRLKELGYVQGRNFTFDIVDIKGHLDRSAEAFKEIVARKPDVLLAVGNEGSLKSALAATHSIPIVMIAFDYDPVSLGYVSSLARPSGNVTGVVAQQIELTVKRLQFVRELFPDGRALTMFWDSDSADQWRVAANAADAMGLKLAGAEFGAAPYDYERAFARVAPEARKILVVPDSAIFRNDAARISNLALAQGAASFFTDRRWVDVGRLLSYGVSTAALFRRAADYIDRIARGAKPSELPIEQPTKFELVINMKTAKALGIAAPPTLLATADDVIE
jgi:putative ABC transport system substrate-binding protein